MNKGLKKIIAIFTIILLIGIGLSPISTSKNIEKKQETSTLEVIYFENGEMKELSLKKDSFDRLISLLTDFVQSILSNKENTEEIIESIDQLNQNNIPFITSIINFIKNRFSNRNTIFSLFKKTFVISQGWNYNFNIYKNSRFEIKRNGFSMFHYVRGSRSGGESKTLILSPDTMFSSKSANLITGRQTGFMIKPTGIFIHESKMFPKTSYTFFIGFSNLATTKGQKHLKINLPLL